VSKPTPTQLDCIEAMLRILLARTFDVRPWEMEAEAQAIADRRAGERV
jgi:hypothetical protein